ncbi:unnamed protein product [Echinostoma caproni]|uniref:C2H2-type domain-containing protein n=1 Tax=Echinostoma caproni TaxID=27848 RepID=A0A183B7A7_9TREM|nr:unnamed protein product [Echinostoma caproni]
MPSPKSKSPKGSPKKNASSKNSPGKQKGEEIIPVETGMQTDPTTVCYLCRRHFKDSAAIQSHIVLMNHMGPYNANEQHCRACKSIVMLKDVEAHKCAVLKAVFLRFMSGSTTLDFGPPYRCLFCRSQPCSSRVELAIHLLCYHRPNKPTGRCGMCVFTYEEPAPIPPPNIPPLPANADEEKKKEHAKALKQATEKQMCEPPINPTPGLDNLKMHVMNEHVPAYTLWSRRNILEDSDLRFPYACPISTVQAINEFASDVYLYTVFRMVKFQRCLAELISTAATVAPYTRPFRDNRNCHKHVHLANRAFRMHTDAASIIRPPCEM